MQQKINNIGFVIFLKAKTKANPHLVRVYFTQYEINSFHRKEN